MYTEHNVFLSETHSILIPRGNRSLPALTFDATSINTMLQRAEELKGINQATYPEFITSINLALIQASRLCSIVEIEYKESLNSLDVAEAVARLDRAEAVLQSKNLKSSADTRDAAVTLDPDVQECIKRKDLLAAMFEWSKQVKLTLERMYYSAKQIIELNDKSTLNMTAGLTSNTTALFGAYEK